MTIFKVLAPLAVIAGGAAHAAPVTPLSYDMINGGTGSYTYWDSTYNGSGSTTTNYSSLSGGTGELTDGYIETRNWNHPAVEPPAGDGPYVGWVNLNPTIVFHFDQAYAFDAVTFYFDASGAGGVTPPASVYDTIGNVNYTIPASAYPTNAPFAFAISGLSTTDVQGENVLSLQVIRGGSWTFLSEVSFDAPTPAVPLPATGLLLAGAFGGMAAWRRRRG